MKQMLGPSNRRKTCGSTWFTDQCCSLLTPLFIMPLPVGKGAISVAFVHPSVRPSVCPSVAYVANNSRTQRPSVPKLGRKLPHLRCDSCTSFKVKKSKIKVTKPTDTHIVRHIFQMPRPMNFKLGIRMEDDDPHQPQTP